MGWSEPRARNLTYRCRQDVREILKREGILTKEELAKLHQEQTSRTLRGAAECPPSDLLARVAIDDVDDAERDRVAVHLASCSDCVEEYRMIASLEDWAKRAAESTSETTVHKPQVTWLPSPSALEIDQAQPADGKHKVVRRDWWQTGAPGFNFAPYAMAASLLILCVMLGLWGLGLRRENQRARLQSERERIEQEHGLAAANQTLDETKRKLDQSLSSPHTEYGKKDADIAELRQRIDELSRPQFNIPITDLEPRGAIRGGATDSAKTIEIAPGTTFFTLILNTNGQSSFNNYLLEIQDHSGKTNWSWRGLRKSEYNTFTIALPVGLFPSNSYRLNLYGMNNGQKTPVQEYEIRIVRR